MNVSVLSTSKKLPMSKSIIKMNTMKVTELRALAKERGLKGYSRLRKADLVHLLEESSSQPVAPPRKEGKRRAVSKVSIIPHPQDMDIFERQEMQKQRIYSEE